MEEGGNGMKLRTHKNLLACLHYNPETGLFSDKEHPEWLMEKPTGNGYLKVYMQKLGWYEFAHRLAHFYMTGQMPTGVIDHINENKLDNRWCNLEHVTQSENRHRYHAGRAKGISLCKSTNKWRADISIEGRSKNLGRFYTEEEAKAAYAEAKVRMRAGEPV